ncbi:LppU family putative lipoprotein [Nocardia australiensis]|uniref:LppU family putative lipoprotein n=1 Tax=Nocardia australiensis TaxID=2887191 RepID=UPI001D15AF14|nr:hypothetical protein [Nocardia australiensis]
MSRQRVRAGITLTVFILGAALSAAAVATVAFSMSNDESAANAPSPVTESISATATMTAPEIQPLPQDESAISPAPTFPAVRGANEKVVTGLQVAVGDCIGLDRIDDDAKIEKTTCGSANSNYTVSQMAPEPTQCPTDADHSYVATLHGTEKAALCLDIDWVTGGCMQLTPDNPKRIDCTAQGTPDGIRVVEVKQDTTNVNTCSKGDRGIVYQQRRFVVCVARL